jgi:hypothetical protein
LLTLLFFMMFGVMCTHLTPTLQMSNALATTFLGLFNVFCVSAGSYLSKPARQYLRSTNKAAK